jgi:hypothetical protein
METWNSANSKITALIGRSCRTTRAVRSEAFFADYIIRSDSRRESSCGCSKARSTDVAFDTGVHPEFRPLGRCRSLGENKRELFILRVLRTAFMC